MLQSWMAFSHIKKNKVHHWRLFPMEKMFHSTPDWPWQKLSQTPRCILALYREVMLVLPFAPTSSRCCLVRENHTLNVMDKRFGQSPSKFSLPFQHIFLYSFPEETDETHPGGADKYSQGAQRQEICREIIHMKKDFSKIKKGNS